MLIVGDHHLFSDAKSEIALKMRNRRVYVIDNQILIFLWFYIRDKLGTEICAIIAIHW